MIDQEEYARRQRRADMTLLGLALGLIFFFGCMICCLLIAIALA